MTRHFSVTALLFIGLLFGAQFDSRAGEKGKKARRQEAAREKAMMGDGIEFALGHSDELKLTKDQKTFLLKLKEKLAEEREKEKEEVEIKEMREDMKSARKNGSRDEANALRDKLQALMEKQAEKWEERTNKELEKILPKEMQAKLKELRGDPEKLPPNPFGN